MLKFTVGAICRWVAARTLPLPYLPHTLWKNCLTLNQISANNRRSISFWLYRDATCTGVSP